MKPDWNKRYTTIAVYTFLVVAAGAVFIAGIFNIGLVWGAVKKAFYILNPIIYGFVIAFILNPLVKTFDSSVFKFVEKKKPRKKLRYGLSIACAYVVAVIVVGGFVLIVVPQLISSFSMLEESLGGYVKNIEKILTDTFDKSKNHGFVVTWMIDHLDVGSITQKIKGFFTDSAKYITSAVPYVASFLSSIVSLLKNAFIGIIVSIYFLISRDKLCAQVKKITFALCKKDKAEHMIRATRLTSKTFEGFVSGKIIDSIIIGILTYIVMAVANIPYSPLVAVIVGVTNFVPFFGPIIGGIIAGFLIVIASPYKLLLYAILVLAIQQFDGNILGPKILGDKVGLGALWIVISLIFMGGILGVTGMFIGVPVFAVLYALVSEAVNNRLAKKEMSTDIADYIRDPSAETHEKHKTEFEENTAKIWRKLKEKFGKKSSNK